MSSWTFQNYLIAITKFMNILSKAVENVLLLFPDKGDKRNIISLCFYQPFL